MAKIILGRIRPVYQGAFDASKTYEPLDRVLYNGNVYECVLATLAGVAPSTSDTTYWSLLGVQGEKGDTGDKGEKGDKGDKGDTGPQGPAGAQGEQGIQGPAGAQGEQGPAGKDGDNGETGPMPAHKWDGTTLSFENADGSYDSGVDLQGPQGVKGDTGPQGPAVPLSNSITSTSQTDAASSYAVNLLNTSLQSNFTSLQSNFTSLQSNFTSLQSTVDVLEARRKAMIGVPFPSRSTTIPEGCAIADGSFVYFADYPELKEVYEAGGFDGMLLAYNASTADQSTYLGKWRPDAATPTGLYLPNLTNRFLRSTTVDVAGQKIESGLPNITGGVSTSSTEAASEWTVNMGGSGAFTQHYHGTKQGLANVYLNNGSTASLNFNASTSSSIYGNSTEVMPQTVCYPYIVYLGRYAVTA